MGRRKKSQSQSQATTVNTSTVTNIRDVGLTGEQAVRALDTLSQTSAVLAAQSANVQQTQITQSAAVDRARIDAINSSQETQAETLKQLGMQFAFSIDNLAQTAADQSSRQLQTSAQTADRILDAAELSTGARDKPDENIDKVIDAIPIIALGLAAISAFK